MNYAYTRVSTGKQSLENQRFEVAAFAKRAGLTIGAWVGETVSGLTACGGRKLGALLAGARKGDVIIVSEISRIGRNALMVMEALNACVTRGCEILTAKEGYRFRGDLSSVALAFAFAVAAQVERDLISQRTREALARRRAAGRALGRRRGFAPAMERLRSRREEALAAVGGGGTRGDAARSLGVSIGTLRRFLRESGGDWRGF